MHQRRPLLLALFISFFAAGVCAGEQGRDVFLIKDGKPAVYLRADEAADSRVVSACEDLSRVFERITGLPLPVTPSDGLVPLYVFTHDRTPVAKMNLPELDTEAFHISVTPEMVCLVGGSPLGAQHAVYTLLRDMGCRWIMPGEIGECLPAERNISVPVQERTESPDFKFRDIWYAYGCSPEGGQRHAKWLRRNRMYRPPIQHGHNLTNTLAVFAPYEKRPELYALIQGERQKTQICTSNAETVALVAKAIAQYCDAHPETEAYSLCPDDNTDFCSCENCLALDSGHIDSGGEPSIADRYQVFLNGVFERLRESHPDLMLTTYSYNANHTDPPVNVTVDPNTCIFATSSVFCSAHGIGDAFCESRQEFKRLLESWTARTEHVFIYEYDPVPYSGGLPWPMWESHMREMAAYRDIGVAGVSFEGQNSWAAYFPNYYLAAQFMWDSELDEGSTFKDMLDRFFLESAPAMSRYYEALASAFRGVTKKAEWGLVDFPKYFSPALVEDCREALNDAEEVAQTDVVKQRLEMVRLSFEEMDAYLAVRRADDSVTYAQYKRDVDRLNNAIDRMESINEDYLLATIAREKTRVGLSDRFAQEQGFINRWLLCGPFDNQGMKGHDYAYPPETAIALDAEYEGKDGVAAVWRQNHTPEWQGYVDLLKEYERTDWVCAYALCWITVEDGAREVMLRLGSNDSIKAFINGEEVWDNKVSRVAGVDDDLIPLTLPEGTSTLLLKIGQSGRDWGFYCRITERDSTNQPDGVRVSCERQE